MRRLGRHEARSACRPDPLLGELAEDFRADDDGHLGQVSLAEHLEVALLRQEEDEAGENKRQRRGLRIQAIRRTRALTANVSLLVADVSRVCSLAYVSRVQYVYASRVLFLPMILECTLCL